MGNDDDDDDENHIGNRMLMSPPNTCTRNPHHSNNPGVIMVAAAATAATTVGKVETMNEPEQLASTGKRVWKGPPIPYSLLPENSNASASTSSIKSISSPTVEGDRKKTSLEAFTQEIDASSDTDSDENGQPLEPMDENDGSVSSSGSIPWEGNEDSSSSEDDYETEAPLLSLEERMLRNQQRNAAFLQSLDEKYQGQVPVELQVQPAAKKARRDKANAKKQRRLEEEQAEAPNERRGMLWRNKPSVDPSLMDAADCSATAITAAAIPPPISLAQRVLSLTSQYPHREGQIRHLIALLHGSIMTSSGRDSFVNQKSAVHIPPPIFLSGPRGTGKTSIAKDILTLLEAHSHLDLDANANIHHYQNQQKQLQSTPHFRSAYINCVTLEPSSIEYLVEDAYRQLHPNSSSASNYFKHYGRRFWEREHHTTSSPTTTIPIKPPHTPNPPNDCHRDDTASKLTLTPTQILTPNETTTTNTTSNEVTEIVTSLPASTLLLPDSSGQDSSEAKEDIQNQATLEPERVARLDVPTNSSNVGMSNNGNESRGSRNKSKDHFAFATSPTVAALGKDPRPTEDIVETPESAVTSFGHRLQRYFGLGGGSAVLVLDDAERLLTMSVRKNTGGEANCLAELLLLPKIMRLNLTIVVISRYSLLYGTRLDNIASLAKSMATLSGSVHGLTIQFPAYKEQQVMTKVLKTEKLLPLIIGTKLPMSCIDDGMGNRQFMDRVVDCFLSALVQFLLDTTIDVNEFVRVGRSLWPVFIEPLHPTRIQDTIASLGMSSLLTEGTRGKGDHEELDNNILGFLGRRFLGEIGKIKSTDLTQVTMDSPLTMVGTDTAALLVIPTKAYTIADLQLPFLRTCLLLAAFICQHNRADNDQKVFSVHGNGRRRRTQRGNESNVEETVVMASTGGDIEQLKLLRPRPFLVERVFSIFATLVSLNPDSVPQMPGSKKRNEYTADSLGSSRLYEDLRSLIDLGFLHPVPFPGGLRAEQMNLNGAKFWCSLTAQQADHLAKKVGVPLDSYLV